MAGGYQTAGETARRGTNVWPDTGGGWMNGRGDDTMTMFKGYAHMVDFFTSFDWWDTEPHDELVNNGNYCLAKPGETYADVPPPRWLRDRANSAWAVRCHMVGSGDRPADRSTVLQRHCTLVDLACGTWRGRLGPSLEAKPARPVARREGAGGLLERRRQACHVSPF